MIFQRIVPAYRKPVFEKLHERIGVLVCYSKPKGKANLDNSKELASSPFFIKLSRFYPGRSETIVLQNILPVLFRERPEVVVSGSSLFYLTSWLLILFRPLFRYKLIAWGHGIGNSEMEQPFSGLRGSLKLFYFRRFDGHILYSCNRRKILEEYISDVPLCVAPNTLDTNYLNKLYYMVKEEGRQRLKVHLKFNRTNNIIFIGRLLRSKGINLLLETFSKLKESMDDVALHIIGDGSEREAISKMKEITNDIYFYGSSYNEVWNAQMIYCSDILFMPGAAGLSIVHAMHFECPVLSCLQEKHKNLKTKNVYIGDHGPEFEFIRHGHNGWILSPDPQELADSIRNILQDKSTLARIKQNARKDIVQNAQIEDFIKGMEKALKMATNGN